MYFLTDNIITILEKLKWICTKIFVASDEHTEWHIAQFLSVYAIIYHGSSFP